MRKDEGGVSPVIATILMVAITVVLAAVLYVLVTNLIPVDGGQKPFVTFGGPECQADACATSVTEVRPVTSLGKIQVTVLANGARVIEPTTLVADRNLTGGGVAFRYTDLAGDGKMNSGDSFVLRGMQAGVSYQIAFLWMDGSEIKSVTVSVAA